MGGTRFPPYDYVDASVGSTSGMPGDAIPFAWPNVTYSTWTGAGSPNHYSGSVFGPWDPSPWFTAAWDGYTGPQGP
jgi:hypothetical protein